MDDHEKIHNRHHRGRHKSLQAPKMSSFDSKLSSHMIRLETFESYDTTPTVSPWLGAQVRHFLIRKRI